MKGIKKVRWTPDQVATLRRMSGTHTPAEMATATGRTEHAVRTKCRYLNLTTRTPASSARWTKAELQYLRTHGGKVSLAEIAAAIGRTRAAVACKAVEIGVDCKTYGERHWMSRHSDADVDLCRQLHEAGLSVPEIAEKMEMPRGTVGNIVHYNTHKKPTTR